jgi:hypothetical protein
LIPDRASGIHHHLLDSSSGRKKRTHLGSMLDAGSWILEMAA